MVMTTKEKTQYKNKWQKENTDSFRLVVKKQHAALIRSAAKAEGLTPNAYILKAIDERMKREVGNE